MARKTPGTATTRYGPNAQSSEPPPGWLPKPAYGAWPMQGGKMGGEGETKRGLKDFLQRALQGGFAPYEGQFTAGMTPEQRTLLASLFGGGGFDTGLGALSDIAQQDALQRAQLMLQPSTERAIQLAQRAVRERAGLGNNLLSTGAQDIESRAISDILGQQQSTLAGLIPALTEQRTRAASAIPAYYSAGYSLAEQPRALEQQNLDKLFQEFLRTTPSGGPLSAMLAFLGQNQQGVPANFGNVSSGGDTTWQILGSLLPLLAAF